MKEKVVRTKEELKKAQEEKVDIIIVEGDLAKKVKNGKKIVKLGAASLAVIGTAIAAAPFTGGASLLFAAPVAAAAGTSTLVIIAAVVVGVALLLAIWKNYEEIEFSAGPPPTLKLKRKPDSD